MKICVFGAGSIGGYLAACLASTHDNIVSVVGRGAHLLAIHSKGLRLISPEGTRQVRFAAAVESADELPPQDIVFVTLKAHALPGAAASVSRLLKPGGHAVFVTNGVPWWWNYGLASTRARLSRVALDKRLWTELGPERAIGCVVYSINEVTEPGTVVHSGNNRWVLGEPTNVATPRLDATVRLLLQAGLRAEPSSDLRRIIWGKLLRNTPFNSLCALTRLTAEQFASVPILAELAQVLTDEVVRVAQASGFDLDAAPANQIIASGGAMNGGQSIKRPSMLQDVLAGRPMEIEAIIGEVQQFARGTNVDTPALDAVYALLCGLQTGLQSSTVPGLAQHPSYPASECQAGSA